MTQEIGIGATTEPPPFPLWIRLDWRYGRAVVICDRCTACEPVSDPGERIIIGALDRRSAEFIAKHRACAEVPR